MAVVGLSYSFGNQKYRNHSDFFFILTYQAKFDNLYQHENIGPPESFKSPNSLIYSPSAETNRRCKNNELKSR